MDIVEDFEDATFAFPIDLGPPGRVWQRATTAHHGGSYSLQPPDTTAMHGQDWTCIVTVPAGATTLRLWGSSDCEPSDRLMVFVGSVGASPEWYCGGVTAWTQTPEIDVSGQESVFLVYRKDSSTDAGQNTVWVDDITFTIPAIPRGWGPVPVY